MLSLRCFAGVGPLLVEGLTALALDEATGDTSDVAVEQVGSGVLRKLRGSSSISLARSKRLGLYTETSFPVKNISLRKLFMLNVLHTVHNGCD